MAYPPAAVESATTAHVPDFTGAFEAYSTTSLLLACARVPLVIIHTIHAMPLKRTLKCHLVKLDILHSCSKVWRRHIGSSFSNGVKWHRMSIAAPSRLVEMTTVQYSS